MLSYIKLLLLCTKFNIYS